MLIVRGKTAINIDALKFFRYDGGDFDQKLNFGDVVQLKTEKAAQVFAEIIEAYERGAKVYRIEEPI